MENQKQQQVGYAFGDLTEQDVRIMVQRYYDSLKNPGQFDPNTYVKSVWYPFAQISYIYNRLVAEHANGIRVYFGNYPPNDSSGNAFPNPNSNSMIFVSTFYDGIDPQTRKKIHKDYFDESVHGIPQDRGEQCQPDCGDTIPVKP